MSTLSIFFLSRQKHVFTGPEHPCRVSCHLSWIFLHEHLPHCIRRRLSYRPTKAFYFPSSGRSLARQHFILPEKKNERKMFNTEMLSCLSLCSCSRVVQCFSVLELSAAFCVLGEWERDIVCEYEFSVMVCSELCEKTTSNPNNRENPNCTRLHI